MNTKTVLGIIVSLVVMIGTVLSIASNYVNKDEYTGSMIIIEKRLDRIEGKVDRLIERAK